MTSASIPATLMLGPTAPPDPQPSTIWRSTSLRDVRVSHDPQDRVAVITPTLAWEGNSVQEPTTWFYGGRWHMLYTGGNSTAGLGYASTGGPSPLGPWTKSAAPVLGKGGSGVASTVYHHSVYLEGTTLYCTYTDGATNTWKVATASADTPTVWTVQPGTIYTPPANNLAPGGAPLGNTCIFKDDDGSYLFLFEYVVNNLNYQVGLARGTSPLGPFTTDNAFMASLWPQRYNGAPPGSGTPGGGPGGPWLVKENGVYILFYHSVVTYEPGAVVATEGFRATSTDLLNWTVDPGNSFIRRLVAPEIDQVADLAIAQVPGGTAAFAFWTASINTGFFSILMSPLMPVDKTWDGGRWAITGGPTDTGKVRADLITATLGSTFSTTTVGSDVLTGLKVDYLAPVNMRATVKSRALVSSTAAGSVTTKLKSITAPAFGYGEDDDTHSLTAGAANTFRNELEVEMLAGTTYTFRLDINNTATGATTTVASGSASSAIELSARPW